MQRRVMGCTSSYEVPKFDDDLTTLCWTNSAVNNTEEVINSPECKCEEVCRSQFSTESVLIGVGGFGTVRLVKKVHGIDEGKEYAIKTIHKATVLQKPTGVENVFTEMCCGILTQESPFISSLMYAFQDQKHLYLVFELAVGGDLRYFLRKSVFGRLSESVAKFFICQIFLALEACHQMNILHRGLIVLATAVTSIIVTFPNIL